MSSSGSEAASARRARVLDAASSRIAARRDSLSPSLTCMPAAVISSTARTSPSLSFSSAFCTSGSIAALASPSARAAARRSAASLELSLNAPSALATAPRSRLLAITSSRPPFTSSLEKTSRARLSRTTATRLSTVWRFPSAKASRSSAAFGSPSATSAAIASIFSSPSPNASFSTAAGSRAQHEKDMKRAATKAAPFFPERKLGLLVRHEGGLILLLVVARDERAPRLRLDRTLGLPHHVELAVGFYFADVYRLMQVVILLVHLGDEARRRLEGLAAHGDAHLVDLEALRLLYRLLPHVDADVGGFHRVVGERLVLVAGDVLRLRIGRPLLDEAVVLGVLHRHEVIPCREMADEGLGIDPTQFFFTH